MPSIILLFLLLFPLSALAAENEAKPAGPPPALIVTAEVTAGQPSLPRTLVGSAEPRFTTLVASETDGLVASLPARKGTRVGKGDVLASLRPFQARLELEEAQAARQEVDARMNKAEADLNRARELFAERIISAEELQARETDLSALRESARRNDASVAILKDRIERMTIRAPFAGTVIGEATEIGQWLGEGDPVVELVDLSIIHVMIPVPEQHLAEIATGHTAEVAFDALPGRSFSGRVTAIIPRAEPTARTFPVQLEVSNPEQAILAGMLARVTFSRGLAESALLVPKDALVPKPDGSGYLVRIVDGLAEIVPIEIIAAVERQFAVRPLQGNLAEGDRVVIRGNERLRPGQAAQEAAGKPTP